MSDSVSELRGRPKIPGNKILADIEEVAGKLDAPPTVEQYNERGEYSAGTARNRFGSWKSALDKAGLDVSTRERVSSQPSERVSVRVSDASMESLRELVNAGIYRTQSEAVQTAIDDLLANKHKDTLIAVVSDSNRSLHTDRSQSDSRSES